MKTNKYVYSAILLVLMASMVIVTDAIAQKKIRTRVKIYSEKLTDDDRNVSVELIKGSGRNMAGVENAEVIISTFKDEEEEIDLVTLLTDSDGKASLIIEKDYTLPTNEDGEAIIQARYEGNDSLRASKRDLEFVNLDLVLSFDEIDSVKQLTISAFETDSSGNKIPVEGIEAEIGVQRLYSVLPLTDSETDKSGEAIYEFPTDIPGDSSGLLNLVVKVIDRKYGTVIKEAQVNWGTITDYNHDIDHRTLFGDQAPWWMIISVIVILAGAWYHFILAVFKVLKMRSLSKGQM